MSWREEYWQSIKSFDTEEKLDLFFYRPVGFVIAKTAFPLRLTPTILTLIGLVLGMSSGYFFYHNESTRSLVIGAVLLIAAGVFDSSDGQMARMGGKSTKFGLILDGLCDNFVFASVYVSCSLTMMPHYGYAIFALAVFAGLCHSSQSSLLDFYNREYLFFGCNKPGYWNATLPEAIHGRDETSGSEQLFWSIHFSWVWQQNKLSGRSAVTRLEWKRLLEGPKSADFQAIYRAHNSFILRCWRLMGANFHTILILTAVFARRFDLYLILGDILFLSAAMLVLREAQGKQDEKMQALLQSRGLL